MKMVNDEKSARETKVAYNATLRQVKPDNNNLKIADSNK